MFATKFSVFFYLLVASISVNAIAIDMSDDLMIREPHTSEDKYVALHVPRGHKDVHKIVQKIHGHEYTVMVSKGAHPTSITLAAKGDKTTFAGATYTVKPKHNNHKHEHKHEHKHNHGHKHEHKHNHKAAQTTVIQTKTVVNGATVTVVSKTGAPAITLAPTGTTTVYFGHTYTIKAKVTGKAANRLAQKKNGAAGSPQIFELSAVLGGLLSVVGGAAAGVLFTL